MATVALVLLARAAGGCLGLGLLDEHARTAYPAAPGRCGGTVPALAVTTTAVNAARAARGGVVRSAFIEAGPRLAEQVDALEPQGAPVAMGDRAGSVGYHLGRPLVHLVGLGQLGRLSCRVARWDGPGLPGRA